MITRFQPTDRVSSERMNQMLDEIQEEIPAVVNNLTEGGETAALSAEQGKVLFQSVNDGKTALETTIKNKGGTVEKAGDTATFAELSAGVESIPAGGDADGVFFIEWNPVSSDFKYSVLNINFIDSGISVADDVSV